MKQKKTVALNFVKDLVIERKALNSLLSIKRNQIHSILSTHINSRIPCTIMPHMYNNASRKNTIYSWILTEFSHRLLISNK